ncbi:hypothetical protein SDC9_185087 [bioreactor metagenome]|uniref:Uncharacterized protein n=1 Tax=bioreactor metagenome TaxID=1076179 RepID=A0A645HEU1_9ZZZZ
MEVTHCLFPAEFELQSPVFHITYIGNGSTDSHIGRNGLLHQHVDGFLLEIVEREGEPALQKTGVDTQVGLRRFFPLHVGVGNIAR